jgi:hypothetical protein
MKPLRRARTLLAASTLVVLAGCSRATVTTGPAGAATVASTVVIDRLGFGRDIPTGGTVSDSAWHKFLDEVVTPRFPGGFSVTRTEGQWRYGDGRIQREDGFALDLFHTLGATPPDSTLEAIAREYIRRFNQEAVARTRFTAPQWLYWSVKPR